MSNQPGTEMPELEKRIIMEAVRGLSDNECDEIIAYVRHLRAAREDVA